jgi:LysM repeat protein
MRLVKSLFILLILSFLIQGQVLAQEEILIDKSNNKVIISGKEFYIHIVKKGQTLYRIAKAYDVNVTDIEKENFNIQAEGLKVGQPVKIPAWITQTVVEPEKVEKKPRTHMVDSGETAFSIAKKYNLTLNELYSLNPGARQTIYRGQKLFLPEKPDSTIAKVLKDDNFIYHIVDSGETFYSIARKYGVKEKKLKKANENLDPNNIPKGEVLKIPLDQISLSVDKPVEEDKQYIYHNVKRGETLFSIGQLYDIDETLIKSFNEQLLERELLEGEYIKLPKDRIKLPVKDTVPETLVDTSKAEFVTETCFCPENSGEEKINVALMLPLYGYTNDTLNLRSSTSKIYERSQIFIDYYEGTLLAVDELRKKGLSVDLHVFDTDNDTAKVLEIINQELFPYFDLIIGPVYSKNIDLVAQRAAKYDIPVVSPLSISSTFLKDFKTGFQISPSNNILYKRMIETAKSFDADNFIIIKNGNKPNNKFAKEFKEAYFKGKSLEEIEHLRYAEVEFFAGDDELTLDSFVDSLHNLVIIPSSDKAFVSDVISRLNTLNETHKVTLIGHPRMINYENIDIRFFHNLNTYIFDLHYIDYSDEDVRDFVYKFRKIFEKEPDKYSFYGYDITYYFLHAFQLFGEKFYCCFDRYYPDLLQMNFNFKRIDMESGFINEKLILLNYQRNYLLRPVIDQK